MPFSEKYEFSNNTSINGLTPEQAASLTVLMDRPFVNDNTATFGNLAGTLAFQNLTYPMLFGGSVVVTGCFAATEGSDTSSFESSQVLFSKMTLRFTAMGLARPADDVYAVLQACLFDLTLTIGTPGPGFGSLDSTVIVCGIFTTEQTGVGPTPGVSASRCTVQTAGGNQIRLNGTATQNDSGYFGKLVTQDGMNNGKFIFGCSL